MIYVFGNSHSHFFTDSHPGDVGWGKKSNKYFSSYSGNFHNPEYRHVLIHKFEERFFPFFMHVIRKIPITKNDYIMFAVGEIDCRWHIPKRVTTQKRSIEDVLEEEIQYFFPTFLTLRNEGYNVLGWGGHPSTTKGHNDDPDNPIFGDCLLRNEISLKWNDMLKEYCDHYNFKFISIIRDLINSDGLTKMEYFLDDYHLKENTFKIVIDKCKQLSIIDAHE